MTRPKGEKVSASDEVIAAIRDCGARGAIIPLIAIRISGTDYGVKVCVDKLVRDGRVVIRDGRYFVPSEPPTVGDVDYAGDEPQQEKGMPERPISPQTESAEPPTRVRDTAELLARHRGAEAITIEPETFVIRRPNQDPARFTAAQLDAICEKWLAMKGAA